MTDMRAKDLKPRSKNDGCRDLTRKVSVLFVGQSADASGFASQLSQICNDLSIEVVPHEHVQVSNLIDADVLLFECRIREGADDFLQLRELKEKRPTLPILVLSQNVDLEFISAAYAAGVCDCLNFDSSPVVVSLKMRALANLDRLTRSKALQIEELTLLRQSLRSEIEKRKKAESERAEAQETANQASKLASLGEMASGIAHEIKSPLGVITAGVSFLRDQFEMGDVNRETAVSMLVDIESMADRVVSIVRGLKSYSRNGDSDPFEMCPIYEIIRDALALCEEAFQLGGIKLILPNTNGVHLMCQPTQISQVLLNLLNNAKHAVEKCESPWVRLEVNDLGDQLEIAVSDSGPLIPKEVRERIFKPFFTTKAKGVGTGLGLSISSKIAAGHGGRLYLDEQSLHTRFVLVVSKELTQPVPILDQAG